MTHGMVTTPSKPSEMPCDWCGEQSVKAIPNNRQNGTFIYVCRPHIKVAEAANSNKPRERKIP